MYALTALQSHDTRGHTHEAVDPGMLPPREKPFMLTPAKTYAILVSTSPTLMKRFERTTGTSNDEMRSS